MVKTVSEIRPPDAYNDPPPPYKEYIDDEAEGSDEEPDSSEIITAQDISGPRVATCGGVNLPCVIPQTTTITGNSRFDFFLRAYVPELAAHGISKEAFTTVIDGLNECFASNPGFKSDSVVSSILSLNQETTQRTSPFPKAHTPENITRSYLEAVNKDFLNPVGLWLYVLSTSDMLEVVGISNDEAQLCGLNSPNGIKRDEEAATRNARCSKIRAEQDSDARLQIMSDLDGYIMSLDTEVPEQNTQHDLFLKIRASRTQRLMQKHDRNMARNEARLSKREAKHERKVMRDHSKLVKLEQRLASQEDEKTSRLSKAKSDKKYDKILAGSHRAENKLVRQIDKRKAFNDRVNDKMASKLQKARTRLDSSDRGNLDKTRWIVILTWPLAPEYGMSDALPSILSDHGIRLF